MALANLAADMISALVALPIFRDSKIYSF